jgi:hypothetical protein
LGISGRIWIDLEKRKGEPESGSLSLRDVDLSVHPVVESAVVVVSAGC